MGGGGGVAGAVIWGQQPPTRVGGYIRILNVGLCLFLGTSFHTGSLDFNPQSLSRRSRSVQEY